MTKFTFSNLTKFDLGWGEYLEWMQRKMIKWRQYFYPPSPQKRYYIFFGYNLCATHSHRIGKRCFFLEFWKNQTDVFFFPGHICWPLTWLSDSSFRQKRYFCPFVLIFWTKICFSFLYKFKWEHPRPEPPILSLWPLTVFHIIFSWG